MNKYILEIMPYPYRSEWRKIAIISGAENFSTLIMLEQLKTGPMEPPAFRLRKWYPPDAEAA